jgi:hypothetical protein
MWAFIITPSSFVRRLSSINYSHFNLLLWNASTKWSDNSHWVDMSLHSDTLFWFRANQSLLFLLNAAFLAKKQQIPILYSFVWQDRGSFDRMAMILYRTYNSFSLFARQLDYCIFKECLIKSRNSHCLYRYQVTPIVLD